LFKNSDAWLHSLAELVPWNRFLGSVKIRALAGQYDKSIPTLFLGSIDCSKIPALDSDPTSFFSAFKRPAKIISRKTVEKYN
jgi:hypothetical protein